MSKKRRLIIAILFFSSPIWAKNTFDHFTPQHHTLSRELEVDVYVPTPYQENHSYPVIYFNDGEGLNEKGYLPLKELEKSIKKGQMQPFIMVAIYAGGRRTSRYTPYEDPWVSRQWGEYTPQAERYTRRLTQQLLPFIEKKYSVDNSQRAMIGLSLGGLQATWMALMEPGLFSFVGALSPSYWVGDYALLKESIQPEAASTRFYFDIGTAEWNYYVPFVRQLEKAGLEYGKNIFYREITGAAHRYEDWKNRIIPIIRLFLTKDVGPPQDWEVVVECIPSQSRPGLFFQRLNPIVELEDDIFYSLAYAADFSIVKGAGKIEEDGRFEVTEGNSMRVQVRYGDWTKEVKVKNCK